MLVNERYSHTARANTGYRKTRVVQPGLLSPQEANEARMHNSRQRKRQEFWDTSKAENYLDPKTPKISKNLCH